MINHYRKKYKDEGPHALFSPILGILATLFVLGIPYLKIYETKLKERNRIMATCVTPTDILMEDTQYGPIVVYSINRADYLVRGNLSYLLTIQNVCNNKEK